MECITALLTCNLSFKFRFTVVMVSCCDALLPVYSKHCDRAMSVPAFMCKSIVEMLKPFF